MKTGSRNYPQNPTLQSVKMGKICLKRSPAQNPLSSGLQHEIRQENRCNTVRWVYLLSAHYKRSKESISL